MNAIVRLATTLFALLISACGSPVNPHQTCVGLVCLTSETSFGLGAGHYGGLAPNESWVRPFNPRAGTCYTDPYTGYSTCPR